MLKERRSRVVAAALVAVAILAVLYFGREVRLMAAHVLGPACAADVPPNPWGYDFCAQNGMEIYEPPPGFCSYFRCDQYFWPVPKNGFVEQCEDQTYSSSGGYLPGGCSRHGGVGRWGTLYQH